MPIFTIGFVLGNVALHGLPALPGWQSIALIPLILLLQLKGIVPKLIGAMAIGFLWTFLIASLQKSEILSPEFEGIDLEAVIRIISIPNDKAYSIRFDAEIEDDYGQGLPKRMRLSLYRKKDDGNLQFLHPGDILNAKLRLKRPHSYMNPGGFDYEKYLFSQRIGATGYIRDFRILERAGKWSPQRLRHHLYERLKSQSTPHIGAIIALALGERGLMKKSNKELLFATGTGHLFAISGLHITLVFGFIFLIFRFLWTRFFLHLTLWPSTIVAMIPAFLAACIYAWLAGFTIPTQRALIMLGCVVVCGMIKRRISLIDSLLPALFIVIVYDPLGTLTASFWMSFLAIGFIAFFLNLHPWSKKYLWLHLPVVLSLALIPVSLWFFGYGALVAPLANIIAVPLLSLLILPCVLLAILCIPISMIVSTFFIHCADFLLNLMWQGSEWIAQVDFLKWTHRAPKWSYIPSTIGIITMTLLSQWRHKLLVAVLLLPLIANSKANFPEGAFETVFLDVGQGLSVLIVTREHQLLFDTGPAYRSGFTTAEVAVMPYLKWRNIKQLDALLVSHGDNDHAGGANLIMKYFKPKLRLGNADVVQKNQEFELCRDGQTWIWDNVHFEIMNPSHNTKLVGNNSSCVLKVTTQEHSLLLTADIEKQAEFALLAHKSNRLQSSVMLVPHHGSLTSSTDAFVAATNPHIAVVTSGYRNRFNLPKEKILMKYLNACARVFNTSETGALTMRFIPHQEIEISHIHRRDMKRYWHTNNTAYSLKNC